MNEKQDDLVEMGLVAIPNNLAVPTIAKAQFMAIPKVSIPNMAIPNNKNKLVGE